MMCKSVGLQRDRTWTFLVSEIYLFFLLVRLIVRLVTGLESVDTLVDLMACSSPFWIATRAMEESCNTRPQMRAKSRQVRN